MERIETARKAQAEAIEAYLIATYGDDHFSADDRERMEFCEDGSVCIGWAVIDTGITLQSFLD